ncbi:MAG TPA: nodulation protein NfeD [Burkholderiaceae bacterium]|nr:nodulation protein NfeD [Burkholderiaceae bacterium]
MAMLRRLRPVPMAAWVRNVALWAWLTLFAAAFASATPVLVLQVHDAIGPGSADYIIHGLEQAREQGAPLVVIELDTPGGLDSAMREIIQAMLASSVPVVVYVSPEGARAASAGTYILYAAQVAAMAPATTLGAATPVAIGIGAAPPAAPASAASGAQPPTDALEAKRVNDAAAFIRGLAQKHGRNAQWAERAVREAVSLTAAEALQQNVIDVVAVDVPDLLAQIDGRSVRVRDKEQVLHTRGLTLQVLAPDWRQRLMSVIANPSLALVLMMIGIYGIVFEFASPGFGVAGVAGAICLLLGLYALQMLPVNYTGLGLLLLGLVLFAAELHAPTFGVLGAGGVVAFIAGGILLFDKAQPGYGVPLWLVLALAASSAIVVLGGGSLAMRAHRRPVVGGLDDLVGLRGEVVHADAGHAFMQLRGETWEVRSASPLRAGQSVRVVARDGLLLDVEPDPAAANDKGEA